MNQIRLLMDGDASDRQLLAALRARRVDVVTTAEKANPDRLSDADQLLHALRDRRVLYTFNSHDFSELHRLCLATDRTHGGIIVASQADSVSEQMRRFLHLRATKLAEDMINQLVFLRSYPAIDLP